MIVCQLKTRRLLHTFEERKREDGTIIPNIGKDKIKRDEHDHVGEKARWYQYELFNKYDS